MSTTGYVNGVPRTQLELLHGLARVPLGAGARGILLGLLGVCCGLRCCMAWTACRWAVVRALLRILGSYCRLRGCMAWTACRSALVRLFARDLGLILQVKVLHGLDRVPLGAGAGFLLGIMAHVVGSGAAWPGPRAARQRCGILARPPGCLLWAQVLHGLDRVPLGSGAGCLLGIIGLCCRIRGCMAWTACRWAVVRDSC